MKETRQLSIGGYAFVLEVDAAEELRRYMNAMENHYMPQEGGKEILEGIEERIAELLLDKHANVVNSLHVQEVINVIGRPENIEAEEPSSPEEPASSARKKLFRDLENKRLGGVCAGLAAYFGWDVTVIRVIFVVLAAVTFFSGASEGIWSLSIAALYFVLWMAMPPARTAQDRWAMKGDGGTIDDIRRNVKVGIREMGETAREAGSGDLMKRIGRTLAIIIGIVFLVTGVAGMASASVMAVKGSVLFGEQIAEWVDEIAEVAPGIFTLASEPWTCVLIALAVLLPFVGLLYGGIQLLFGFKSPSWRPGLCIFVAWLVVVVVLMVLGFAGVISFSNPIEIV